MSGSMWPTRRSEGSRSCSPTTSIPHCGASPELTETKRGRPACGWTSPPLPSWAPATGCGPARAGSSSWGRSTCERARRGGSPGDVPTWTRCTRFRCSPGSGACFGTEAVTRFGKASARRVRAAAGSGATDASSKVCATTPRGTTPGSSTGRRRRSASVSSSATTRPNAARTSSSRSTRAATCASGCRTGSVWISPLAAGMMLANRARSFGDRVGTVVFDDEIRHLSPPRRSDPAALARIFAGVETRPVEPNYPPRARYPEPDVPQAVAHHPLLRCDRRGRLEGARDLPGPDRAGAPAAGRRHPQPGPRSGRDAARRG